MENVICDKSAFRLYRTPPAVLALFDELPIARDQATRQSLVKQPFVQYVLGAPLHVLVTERSKRTSAQNIKQHLWTGDLPCGAIQEIEGLGVFTSPELTLLLLARWMTVTQLALVMYEFCGSFTVYKMPPELSLQISQFGFDVLNTKAGWHQVIDFKGNPTDLWSRPPLITLESLRAFAQENRKFRGGVNFAKAADMVAGMTRSPLEAKAALLLSASRRKGGCGYRLKTNKKIFLTRSARKIYQHDYCEADIYIESPDRHRIVDVECQGAAIHSGERAVTSDANRTTALESMGINVVQITNEDIQSSVRLDVISQHIDARLNMGMRVKTDKMRKAELRLRKEIPSTWFGL